MANAIIQAAEQAMQKQVERWTDYTKKIRTGRANANMLSSVMVDFYGTPTPLNQTAQISSPEPQQLVIKPYDRSQVSAVVAGINKADLGLNPMSEADLVRINIPPLTEEVRKDLVKKMMKELESYKVAIRNERRDANDKIKKDKSIPEDQVKGFETDIQALTDKYISELDKLTKEKEKDLMTI